MKTNEDKMTWAEIIGTALTMWALLAMAIWS